MAQLLLALAAFSEDLRLIPNSHMAANNHLSLQSQKIQCLFLPSGDTVLTW